MNETRDERLGELLAAYVDAPPAVPEFTERLWQRIDAAGIKRDVRRRSLWRRRPLLAAAVFAAAAAAVLAVSLLGGGDTAVKSPVIEPLLKLGGPADASAAEVVAKARTALATVRALRAHWEWSQASVDIPYDQLPRDASIDEILDSATVGALTPYYPYDLTLTAGGHSRWEADVSYELSSEELDDELLVRRVKGEAANGAVPKDIQIGDEVAGASLFYSPEMRYPHSWRAETAEQNRGYAAGPPDANLTALLPFGPSPSAFSSLENGRVRESTYEGRPALTIVAPVKPGPVEIEYDAQGEVWEASTGILADKLQFTVDLATYLPVRMASYLRGKLVEVWTLSNLRVNGRVPASTFEFAFRKGVKPEQSDFGFRDAALLDVTSLAGYEPVVPSYLPTRFHPTSVRFASRTSTWIVVPSGETREVISHQVTSAGYRAGFLHLTVTMRPSAGLDPDWLADPFVEDPSAGGATVGPEEVVLGAGALAGARAKVALPPLGTPHLWVVHDGVLVTVAGDVTRADLLRIADSLKAVRAGEAAD